MRKRIFSRQRNAASRDQLIAANGSLMLDFLSQAYKMNLQSKNFADIITFTRASAATRVNPLGLIESVAANLPCIDHSPVNLATGTGVQTLALAKDRTYAITAVGGTVVVTGAGVNVAQMGAASGVIQTPAGSGTVDVTFTPAVGTTALHVREVLGLSVWEQRTNKSSNYNVNPTALTNMVKGGDAAAVLSVVSDVAALAAAGLSGICSNGNVYKLDNSAGASGAWAIVGGTVGNTNKHSLSCFARVTTGSATLELSGGSGIFTPIPSAAYTRLKIENFTPQDASRSIAIVVAAGSVAYFIANQIEEGAVISPLIPVAGAQVTRAADQAPLNTLSPWFKSTEGTFVFEGEFGNGRWQVTGKTSYLDIIGTDNTGKNGFARNSAGNIVVTSAQLPVLAKMAVSWGPAGSKICVNGGAVQSGAAVPDFSSGTIVAVGRGFDTASFFNGHARRFKFLKSQLSDASHQSITA